MAEEARLAADQFRAITTPVGVDAPMDPPVGAGGALPESPTPAAREDPPPVVYDETGQCSICIDDFQDGELVCRLRCRHMFHTACWDGLMGVAATINEATHSED